MSDQQPVAVLARIPAQPGSATSSSPPSTRPSPTPRRRARRAYYILHTNDADPDAVLFYELYENEAALVAHGTQRRVQGDRPQPARPRRRTSGDHPPDAGQGQGALTATYLDRIVARHRELAAADERPLDALIAAAATGRAGAGLRRCARRGTGAGGDRRDQAPFAVEGRPRRRPRPRRRGLGVRRRWGGVPLGAHRRRVLRRIGGRPRSGRGRRRPCPCCARTSPCRPTTSPMPA